MTQDFRQELIAELDKMSEETQEIVLSVTKAHLERKANKERNESNAANGRVASSATRGEHALYIPEAFSKYGHVSLLQIVGARAYDTLDRLNMRPSYSVKEAPKIENCTTQELYNDAWKALAILSHLYRPESTLSDCDSLILELGAFYRLCHSRATKLVERKKETKDPRK